MQKSNPFLRKQSYYLDVSALEEILPLPCKWGQDLAYMGTRFINTKESKAPDAYCDMIIEAGASDIVYTAAVSGVPANFLGPSLNAMGITEEDVKQKSKS